VPAVSRKQLTIFRILWRTVNTLLIAALVLATYSAVWEYSVRRYLKGFSDAIVPSMATPEEKIDSILTWIRSGAPRPPAPNLAELSNRDPEDTLNSSQLLTICGTATNAFLNLSRSAGLNSRRLLLLTPERTTKHVVAEVLVNGRWIIVDATYRTILRDAQGHTLTRKELQNPAIFAEATGGIPGYLPSYDYQKFAHVRLARLPLDGLGLRYVLRSIYPTWEEDFDWSLLLERESFFFFCVSSVFFIVFLAFRILLAWYADHHLRVPRFRFRRHIVRAGATFFSPPEIEE
jgi:hypothetical protein